MRALRLLRFELTVSDLGAAERFFLALPGFAVERRDWAEPVMAVLLGAEAIEQVWLSRGGQVIVLQQFSPPGLPYPAERRSCDGAFQHFALPVADATASVSALPDGTTPISTHGAQQLPAASGGATAFKFRDAEGHPLELIQFADQHAGGVDHSAVVSADAERSIAFYRDTLGMTVGGRQINRGTEQDRLDGLEGTVVEVIAMQPAEPTPHVELLAYRSPAVQPAARHDPADIAATRLVLAVDSLAAPGQRLADGTVATLVRDPDGHLLLLLAPA